MPQSLHHAHMRWQLRRALLESERATTRDALADARTPAERAALTEKLADLEHALRAMGPDPAPKMG